MSKEIERKYLLRGLPPGANEGIEIKQGYLSVSDPEVRVRQKGGKFFLTEKSGAGLIREENECEISKNIFDVLWSLTAGARIEKTRYEFAADGLIWEIDEFRSPRTKGLFIAEVELPDTSRTPEIPPVIRETIEKEVTADENYQNKNLAINGMPNWKGEP